MSDELLRNEDLDVEGHLKKGADEPEDTDEGDVEAHLLEGNLLEGNLLERNLLAEDRLDL